MVATPQGKGFSRRHPSVTRRHVGRHVGPSPRWSPR